MAYDPEARKQSNSALIIGLISLLVLGGAALAYFATRPTAPDETSPVLINTRKETIIVNATPAPPSTTTIIVGSPTAVPVAPETSTTTTTTTTRNADPAPRAPVAAPPADEPKTTVNNTTINPPAPKGAAQPVKPDVANSGDVPTDAPPVADGNEVQGY